MIVKMRKMDLLLYHREQERFLEELRNLGVVHITAEQPIEAVATQEQSANAARAQRIVAALIGLQKQLGVAAPPSALTTAVPEALANYEACEARRDRIEQEIAAVKKDISALAPWGNFDPSAVKRLAESGVAIKFYAVPQKKFGQVDKSKYNMEIIAEREGFVFFAVVFKGEAEEVAGADEVRLPDASISSLTAKVAALEAEGKEVAAKIEKMIGAVPAMKEYCAKQLDCVKFEEARLSMESAANGKILKLSGWVPRSNEANLAKFLDGYPAYVEFRDPSPDDNVPVKLKNDNFSRLYEPVLKLYSLPSYRGMDMAPFAAPFFTVFYGLCLGDSGYGLLFLIISLLGLQLAGKKMKGFMYLGLMFGITAIIAGTLTDSCCGVELMKKLFCTVDANGAIIEQSRWYGILAPFASFERNGGTVFPAMSFAMVMGFIQVFTGMSIRSYMQMRDGGFWAGLVPIAQMFMALGAVVTGTHHPEFLNLRMNEFAAGPLEVGAWLNLIPANVAQGFVFGGLAVLLLFNNINKTIFIRPLMGLWILYNYAFGLLSNILSYLRLFALGLAGGLLANAMNYIAFMIIKDADGNINMLSIGMVGTVIVLLAGHGLNIVFSGLGAFIHSLRLTFVEFYGVVDFQGNGKPYTPFAKVDNK
ncbi:MAG: hypothetical protein LBH93_01250 [Chitinispirillales bacterium]|jgi:V/A-type H+-transporting ATPase subunit I|nr:hypothetical protein [Chitinispirillales bacterium]